MHLSDYPGRDCNSVKETDSVKMGCIAMKLIIQSDDLGITEAVSCGIAVQQERSNYLYRIVSNMPAAPFAVELMKPYPQICLGEDINLVAGRPCADPEKVPSLVQKMVYF